MATKKRRNLHKEILDPGIEYLESKGATCPSFHGPRSMVAALKGHPDMMVLWSGITWYVEIKPWITGRKPPLNNTQMAWFWKFYTQFNATIRYSLATSVEDLLVRVRLDSEFDISVPAFYYEKFLKWKEDNDGA